MQGRRKKELIKVKPKAVTRQENFFYTQDFLTMLLQYCDGFDKTQLRQLNKYLAEKLKEDALRFTCIHYAKFAQINLEKFIKAFDSTPVFPRCRCVGDDLIQRRINRNTTLTALRRFTYADYEPGILADLKQPEGIVSWRCKSNGLGIVGALWVSLGLIGVGISLAKTQASQRNKDTNYFDAHASEIIFGIWGALVAFIALFYAARIARPLYHGFKAKKVFSKVQSQLGLFAVPSLAAPEESKSEEVVEVKLEW